MDFDQLENENGDRVVICEVCGRSETYDENDTLQDVSEPR